MYALKKKKAVSKKDFAKCSNCNRSDRPLLVINGQYVCKPCSKFFTPSKKA